MHVSPDLVINWIEIWTVCRPQIWRNEVWCFSTQNLHSFTRTFTLVFLQGNVATKLSYGGKFFILVMSHFLSDSDIEKNLKIDQHLPKLKVAQFFWLTVYNQGSASNGYRDIQWRICDAMVQMTLNDLDTKVKVIHFGTNLFIMYMTSYRLSIVTSARGRTV